MSTPQYTIAHTLLLNTLDEETGQYRIPTLPLSHLDYALAGAILVELQFAERLRLVQANHFCVTDGPPCTDVLEWAIQQLGTGTFQWHQIVTKLAETRWSTPIRMVLLNDLLSKGVVEKKQDRFLFLSYRTRYPLDVNTTVKEACLQALLTHATTVEFDTPATPLDGLLSLLHFLKLLELVLGETVAARPVIKLRTERVPIGLEVHIACQNAQSKRIRRIVKRLHVP